MMTPTSLSRGLTICLLAWTVPAVAQSGSPTASEIIERADSLMHGDSAQGVYEMKIVRPDWDRTMRFRFWSEGAEKSFIRMEEPAKDRGVGFLKIGREMWNYVPRINRVIKIPPSMMLQSWMGSDFTNEDLVRESAEVYDYDHELLGVEEMFGKQAYKLSLRPKPDIAVAWDHIVEWIGVDDYLPLRADYYNERGEVVRTMSFTEVRNMGGRMLPTVMEIRETKKEGHSTILILVEMEFDRKIARSVFTQQNLKRGV